MREQYARERGKKDGFNHCLRVMGGEHGKYVENNYPSNPFNKERDSKQWAAYTTEVSNSATRPHFAFQRRDEMSEHTKQMPGFQEEIGKMESGDGKTYIPAPVSPFMEEFMKSVEQAYTAKEFKPYQPADRSLDAISKLLVERDRLVAFNRELVEALETLADLGDCVPIFQLDDGKATVKAVRLAGKFTGAMKQARAVLAKAREGE